MPEPRSTPLAQGPPPLWPEGLPDPQAASMGANSPARAEHFHVLSGPVRARVVARTAPMTFDFSCWLTQPQMRAFEDWYRIVALDHDGEFYARWVGGSRIVAFLAPYRFEALGAGYVLSGELVRTRIDHTVCDAYIGNVFGRIYRDDGDAVDVYRATLSAVDIYRDQFDVWLVAENEC